MFTYVIGEGRCSNVCLCHRWRDVFQCLPMYWGEGGQGETKCVNYVLVCAAFFSSFFFFFFFCQCRVHGWSEVFIFFYIGILCVCWAAVPQDSTVNTYFHKKHNYSHKMCTLANVLCACTFLFQEEVDSVVRSLMWVATAAPLRYPLTLYHHWISKLQYINGGSCHKYNFCRDKQVFVTTKHVFCHDKCMLVMTKVLSRQNYVCCNKTSVTTNIWCSKRNFVMTKVLSQQTCLCVCFDKMCLLQQIFVTTNILSCQT